MKLRLVHVETGDVIEIVDGVRVTIGRHADVSVRDVTVSRCHAVLDTTADPPMIEDAQSASGILVDGVRVDGVMPLAEGEVVRLGRASLRLGPSPAPSAGGWASIQRVTRVFLEPDPWHQGPGAAPLVISTAFGLDVDGLPVTRSLWEIGHRAGTLVLDQGCEHCGARGAMGDRGVTVRKVGDVVGWVDPAPGTGPEDFGFALVEPAWMPVAVWSDLFDLFPPTPHRADDPLDVPAPSGGDVARLLARALGRFERESLYSAPAEDPRVEALWETLHAAEADRAALVEVRPAKPEGDVAIAGWTRGWGEEDDVLVGVDAPDGVEAWMPVGRGCWGRLR